MALAQLFKVATEFRFEIGSAVFSANALQREVQGISHAVQGAELAFKRMAIAGALNMGLGTTSIVGTIKQAIDASERFKNSQIQLSTIFAANKDKLIGPVDEFNSRMQVSEQILRRIARLSAEFSLDEGAFADTTKQLGAVLISKGLAGSNLENSIELSKNFLKSAPLLGVDPGLAQNQLINIIEGAAGQQNTLFRRLTSETSAFARFGAGGEGAKGFNLLDEKERFAILNEGLAQFASSQQELEAQTRTIRASLTVLRNTFVGLDGVLRPLGDAVVPTLVEGIQRFTAIVHSDFRVILESVAGITKLLTRDFEALIVTMTQLSNLSRDFGVAAKTLGVLGILSIITHLVGLARVLRFLGATVVGVKAFLFRGASALGWVFMRLGFVLKALVFIVRTISVPFMALVGIFQLISRAIGFARVADARALPALIAHFMQLTERAVRAFSVIIAPIMEVIDALAKFISPIFRLTNILVATNWMFEGFVILLELFAKVTMLARAGLEGLFFALFQFYENLTSGKFLSLGEGMGTAFSAGVDSILEKYMDRMTGDEAPISQQLININGGVRVTQNFKENQEPDRIAFSLTEQLMKIARNPTQATSGGGFTRGGNN